MLLKFYEDCVWKQEDASRALKTLLEDTIILINVAKTSNYFLMAPLANNQYPNKGENAIT